MLAAGCEAAQSAGDDGEWALVPRVKTLVLSVVWT